MTSVQTLNDLLGGHLFPSLAAPRPMRGEPLHVAGLEGSATSAFVASQFLREQGKGKTGQILFLAADAKSAETMAEDLEGWLGDEAVIQFPGLDLKPYEWRHPFGHLLEQRLNGFEALYRKRNAVVVITLSDFLLKLNSPESLHLEILAFQKGETLSLRNFRETLLQMGFREENTVQDIGEFSVRGEIIDVYPYLAQHPFRIVLFGDSIEAIKEFDIFTQRSLREVEAIEIFPLDECSFTPKEIEAGMERHFDRFLGEGGFEAENHKLLIKRDFAGIHWQKAFFKELRYTLLDFLGPDPLVVLGDAEAMANTVDKVWSNALEGHAEAVHKDRWICRPNELWLDGPGLERLLGSVRHVRLSRVSWEGRLSRTLNVEAQTRAGAGLKDIDDRIRKLAQEGVQLYLTAPNEGQADRLRKLAVDLPVAGVVVGHLDCGFTLHDDAVAIWTDHQIFNRFSRKVRQRRQKGGGVSIQNFEALTRGDVVVHEDYGVGRFVGIKRIVAQGHAVDCILLDFSGTDKLALPVTDLGKLEKFSSEEGHIPQLSKLGGKSWEITKEKTRKAVLKLAQELIELYAQRSVVPGYPFAADGPLQAEFDQSFEWELTPDQAKAVQDSKNDMEAPRPMDRLICGDVGFGKTEVAMRAAFKAVADKKQVAVLAPTTILAAQHFDRFVDRFSSFPVRIESLTRFRTAKEQKEALKTAAEGGVDILIGTHRLLSKDVVFKDVGLLIIDEEQKFGVKQKERLKELRTQVDVLSMSATPIPRTLHMALIGTRDLSIIATPPRNRLPIETRVLPWDGRQIRDAINHELSRGGQVYFVHNRVQTMPETLEKLQALVPQARIGMAHGQMEEGELERVMSAFIAREYDILCCTAIIESGLDITNVNTMIVDRAELFGMSQLYQLRGRVGRSSAKAYCLLISPDANRFNDDMKKRLYSLEKFTELGSGFQIAMRDLEVRGAGNILGHDQSGHIATVGYETYVRLLQDAVKELQGQKKLPPLQVEIDFPLDAYLPEEYVADGLTRTAVYQKLTRLEALPEIDDLDKEMKDRFGPLPEPAHALLQTMRARLVAQKRGFATVELQGPKLLLTFAEAYQPDQAGLAEMVPLFKRTMRFIATKPLQIAVELNPPKGDHRQAIDQAIQVLRGLWVA